MGNLPVDMLLRWIEHAGSVVGRDRVRSRRRRGGFMLGAVHERIGVGTRCSRRRGGLSCTRKAVCACIWRRDIVVRKVGQHSIGEIGIGRRG